MSSFSLLSRHMIVGFSLETKQIVCCLAKDQTKPCLGQEQTKCLLFGSRSNKMSVVWLEIKQNVCCLARDQTECLLFG